MSKTKLIITFPSQINLFLLTALTIVQAGLLFSQYGCTELPERSYVSEYPAIEPVGEFFNLKNAVLASNASEVGTLFSDNLFAGTQNVFLQKYELGSKFVATFNLIFQSYLFELKISEQNIKYDLDGNFMIGRGHTEFQGKLIRDIKQSEPIHETIKKLTGNNDKTFVIPPVINIYAIWEADKIGWKILYLEINGVNMFELLQ